MPIVHRVYRTLILLTLPFILAVPAFAQSNTQGLGTIVPELGGANNAVIDHGIIYTAGDNGISLLDSATHRALAFIGGTTWQYQTIAVVHPYLYYAGSRYIANSAYYYAGAVNVSDPRHPVLLGTYNLNQVPMNIAASGSKAYIGDQTGRLRIIDFSNPSSPGEPGGYNMPSVPSFIQVVDTLAYVADGPGGLRILSVKNSLLPVEVGSIARGEQISVVRIRGNRMLTRESSIFGGDVKIYDLTDRIHPALVDSIEVSCNSFDLQDSLLVMTGDSLYTWSVPASGRPYRLSSAPLGDLTYGSMSLSGGLAVTARLGVQTYDVSDPRNIRAVHYWFPPNRSEDLTRVGSFIVSVDGHTARILDFTDPTSPVETGMWGNTASNAYSVTGHDTLVFIAAGFNGLQVVSIADPREPVTLGSYDTPEEAHGIAVQGTTAYLANGISGLYVFDVSNPRTPTPIGYANTPGTALKVSVKGSIACVADADSGLAIFDVSNPTSPLLKSYVHTPNDIWDVVQVDSFAYLAEFSFWATNNDNLRILNIADPANPVTAATYPTMTTAKRLTFDGTYLYAATVEQGFEILDISNRTSPAIVASYNHGVAGNGGNGIATDGSNVYVSLYADGVQAVRNLLVGDLPVPTSPYLGASGVAASPTLQWKAYTAATKYRVQLSTSSSFTTTMVDDSSLTGTSRATSALSGTTTYFWRVRALTSTGWSFWSPTMSFRTGLVTGVENELTLPATYALMQNFPNPFNPSTSIRFTLPTRSMVRLEVYNMLGQRIAELMNGERAAGVVTTTWNANVASGVYFYRLEATSVADPSQKFTDIRKMVLLR